MDGSKRKTEFESRLQRLGLRLLTVSAMCDGRDGQ